MQQFQAQLLLEDGLYRALLDDLRGHFADLGLKA